MSALKLGFAATVVLASVAALIVYGMILSGLPVTGYSVYWVFWLVVGFGVPEFMALRTKTDCDRTPRSLSRNSWVWFAVTGKGKGAPLWRLRRLALLVLMAWLSTHMLTGGAF